MFSQLFTQKRLILGLLGFIILSVIISIVNSPKVGSIIEALTPPKLPPAVNAEQVWKPQEQNWTEAGAEEYHFKDQGSRILKLPMRWFMALEKPTDSIWGVPFAIEPLFSSNQYLLRFGFIKADKSKHNPYGLPIGFAATPYQDIDGLTTGQYTSVGFSCAACHTGQLVYEGKQHIIEGGPAMIDLGQLTKAIAAALGQTALAQKLPLLNGRFERFAKRVLGDQYSDGTKLKLAADMTSFITVSAERPGGIEVTEGFSRLDALNRIGNQVFSVAMSRQQNYVEVDAPVNYPHIWTASWFDWVQYDGSIMQPLVRNVGEAMGLAGYINFDATSRRFSTEIPLANLHWIEKQLAGAEPLPQKKFTGLAGPRWPESFPKIDEAKAEKGAKLYEKHCQRCHLPALTHEVAAGEAPDSPFWDYWSPIEWYEDGEIKQTRNAVLNVKIIDEKRIGTDPAQANVLIYRTVNTAGSTGGAVAGAATSGAGIDIDVCTLAPNAPGRAPGPLVNVPLSDGPAVLFALALGAIVDEGIQAWYRDNYISPPVKTLYQGDRPNCLQSGRRLQSETPERRVGHRPLSAQRLGPNADGPVKSRSRAA